MSTADQMIEALGLKPLPMEGGYYIETYRSSESIPRGTLPDRYLAPRTISTAIYFLITHDVFSAIHRVKSDEVYHFYLGDPVEMLQLHPDGSHETITIGPDLPAGQRPQVIVPHGTWQGSRVKPGGEFALMGTTVAPGFEFDDFENGKRAALVAAYPDCEKLIVELTHG